MLLSIIQLFHFPAFYDSWSRYLTFISSSYCYYYFLYYTISAENEEKIKKIS